MPIIKIHHDDMIISFNPDKPETFFVKHEVKHTSAFYKQLSREMHAGEHIGVYRITFPDVWLPEFITITEAELDIHINHTRTRI